MPLPAQAGEKGSPNPPPPQKNLNGACPRFLQISRCYNINMQLKLLFIAILFSLTFSPLLAFGKTNATSAPFKQAPVQFRNDIFNPYWLLSIPTAFTNDMFDPIWYMKVASHFTNDVFNKGLWWSGYKPPQYIPPLPTPTPVPKPTPKPALKSTPKPVPTPQPPLRERYCFIDPDTGIRACTVD